MSGMVLVLDDVLLLVEVLLEVLLLEWSCAIACAALAARAAPAGRDARCRPPCRWRGPRCRGRGGGGRRGRMPVATWLLDVVEEDSWAFAAVAVVAAAVAAGVWLSACAKRTPTCCREVSRALLAVLDALVEVCRFDVEMWWPFVLDDGLVEECGCGVVLRSGFAYEHSSASPVQLTALKSRILDCARELFGLPSWGRTRAMRGCSRISSQLLSQGCPFVFACPLLFWFP